MQLPIKIPIELMQTRWASILNPLLAQPISSMHILDGVSLISGNTVINHLLGRMQQGWFILDINASANIYRSAPLNSSTLTLNSSAPVTVSIGVF